MYIVLGWGCQHCQSYKALYEPDGVGYTPGDPQSVSLNASCHN